jgi:hypothetical protein
MILGINIVSYIDVIVDIIIDNKYNLKYFILFVLILVFEMIALIRFKLIKTE